MHVITINSVFCTSTKPWKQTWNPVAFSLHSIPSSLPISFHITLVICWKIVLAILDLGEKKYFMKIAFRDESARWHLLSTKMVVACCGEDCRSRPVWMLKSIPPFFSSMWLQQWGVNNPCPSLIWRPFGLANLSKPTWLHGSCITWNLHEHSKLFCCWFWHATGSNLNVTEPVPSLRILKKLVHYMIKLHINYQLNNDCEKESLSHSRNKLPERCANLKMQGESRTQESMTSYDVICSNLSPFPWIIVSGAWTKIVTKRKNSSSESLFLCIFQPQQRMQTHTQTRKSV